MKAAETCAQVEARLRLDFAPLHLELTDNSALHRGHGGWRADSCTHLAVDMVSARFAGLARTARHRLVHSSLAAFLGDDGIDGGIHALELRLRAPDEATN